MRRTIARAACLFLFLPLLFPPAAAPASADPKASSGETMEAVERDLVNILKEMKAIQSELDRLEEIAALPKATGLRIEVHRAGTMTAPVRARVLVQGKVEEERDFTEPERDAFSGAVPAPLVLLMPYLPGTYHGRIEVFHPSWKTAPHADFAATILKGESFPVRFRLSVPGGKDGPALIPVVER